MVNVKVFYDPKTIGYRFFKEVYVGFDLPTPTPEEMVRNRSSSTTPSGEEIDLGWTSFSPLAKDNARTLVNLLLENSRGITRIEVSELEE